MIEVFADTRQWADSEYGNWVFIVDMNEAGDIVSKCWFDIACKKTGEGSIAYRRRKGVSPAGATVMCLGTDIDSACEFAKSFFAKHCAGRMDEPKNKVRKLYCPTPKGFTQAVTMIFADSSEWEYTRHYDGNPLADAKRRSREGELFTPSGFGEAIGAQSIKLTRGAE